MSALDKFNTLVRPRRAYAKSPAAVARPANQRPVDEVIDAEFEPAAPAPAAPRTTLEDLRVRWHRKFAALCREQAVVERAFASEPSTTEAQRATALTLAAQHEQWASDHDRTVDFGSG